MLTLLSFDQDNIPVPEHWKQRMAKAVAETATERESSFDLSQGRYGRYKLSLEAAADRVCPKDLRRLVVHCLRMSWNESLDFAKQYGYEV